MKKLIIIGLMCSLIYSSTQSAAQKSSTQDESGHGEKLDDFYQKSKAYIEKVIDSTPRFNENKKENMKKTIEYLEKAFKPDFIKRFEEIQKQTVQSDAEWYEVLPVVGPDAQSSYEELIEEIKNKYLPSTSRTCIIQ